MASVTFRTNNETTRSPPIIFISFYFFYFKLFISTVQTLSENIDIFMLDFHTKHIANSMPTQNQAAKRPFSPRRRSIFEQPVRFYPLHDFLYSQDGQFSMRLISFSVSEGNLWNSAIDSYLIVSTRSE